MTDEVLLTNAVDSCEKRNGTKPRGTSTKFIFTVKNKQIKKYKHHCNTVISTLINISGGDIHRIKKNNWTNTM